MSELRLRLIATRPLAPRIRAFTLADAEGKPLPPADAGSHLELAVRLPSDAAGWRAYSLVREPAPGEPYEIAVLREEAGTGGSVFMHDRLMAGDIILAKRPKNDFPLAAEARSHLLVAGGIGITPILAMARALLRQGAAFALHYCARSPDAMAYREELAALAGARARFYFDGGDPARGLDLAALLGTPQSGCHVYICGPRAMNTAALAACERAGWDRGSVHLESFAAPATEAGDRPVEVVLRRTGKSVMVPADCSILDAVIAAGADPLFDCKRGDCGLCATKVIEGTPLHRDQVLSAAEKAAGGEMCICVSRALTPQLVLDL